MKEKIRSFCSNLGIEYMGVTSADCMEDLKKILLLRRERYGLTAFEEADIEKRTNPKLIFSGAKSIIVCLFPYKVGDEGKSNISKYAKIPDYHKIAADKLNEICNFIKHRDNSVSLFPFVDTGPLADKYLAYLAGLGFWGKNTLIINEKYGSYIFIGYIITDLALEPDRPQKRECDGCNLCIKNCPGNAIGDNFDFNALRCVSYITQLKDIDDEQKKILLNQSSVYGCDVCQEVCPHNKDVPKTPILEFYEKSVGELLKNELLYMTNREFKQKYGDFPFSWRGKKAILKNFVDKT